MQIGYCGLDKQSLGVGPEGGSLDISSYCAGYVSQDFAMMLLQARPPPQTGCAPVVRQILKGVNTACEKEEVRFWG